MIHSEIPSTPFSTCLSGSAKETEGRLWLRRPDPDLGLR